MRWVGFRSVHWIVVGLVVGDLVGRESFRVKGREMEEEGKLGGGGWWMRLLGASCGRARACASSPLASSIPNPDPVVK